MGRSLFTLWSTCAQKLSITKAARALAALLALIGTLYLCPSTARAQDAFAGVWRAGNDPYYLWVGVDWNNFNAK